MKASPPNMVPKNSAGSAKPSVGLADSLPNLSYARRRSSLLRTWYASPMAWNFSWAVSSPGFLSGWSGCRDMDGRAETYLDGEQSQASCRLSLSPTQKHPFSHPVPCNRNRRLPFLLNILRRARALCAVLMVSRAK